MGSPLRGRGSFVLDRNEGLVCFPFPFGMFLHVVPALRDEVTIRVRCWLGAPAASRGCCTLFYLWLGFEPLSEASLRALSYYRCVSWWSSLRPSVFGCPLLSPVFFPVPCYGYMFTSTTLAPGLRLSLAPCRVGLEPLSEAPLCVLQPLAPSFLVVLAEAACLRRLLDLSIVLP